VLESWKKFTKEERLPYLKSIIAAYKNTVKVSGTCVTHYDFAAHFSNPKVNSRLVKNERHRRGERKVALISAK
jgi:hypothetical protein